MTKNRAKTLDQIYGDTARSTHGAPWPSSSGKIRSARAAGVVRDQATPPEILKLAAELPNAPIAESSKSGQEKLIEKYKIADGRAHMTTEQFLDVLFPSTRIDRLKDLGVTHITIAGQLSFQAEFQLLDKLDSNSDPSTINSIRIRTLRTGGISGALRDASHVALINSAGQPIGILSANNIDPALISHTSSTIGDRHYTPDTLIRDDGNFYKYIVLGSWGGDLRWLMKQFGRKEFFPLTYHFDVVRKPTDLPMVVGNLIHPDDYKGPTETLKDIFYSDLAWAFSRAKSAFEKMPSSAKNPEQFARLFFGDASAFLINEETRQQTPIAVLKRPEPAKPIPNPSIDHG